MSGLITIFKTFNLAQLAVAKSLLTEADIEFVVLNENFASLYSGFYNITGYIEIQVQPEDQFEGREILAELIKIESEEF